MPLSSSKAPPVLILHVGWARGYAGDPDDPVQGVFGYIKEGNVDMGDALNFKPFAGVCYGYAPARTMDVSRLGSADADQVGGVLVVWTATNPDGSGRYVVGWYRNATVFSRQKPLRPGDGRPEVIVKAAQEDCEVVPEDERTF